MLEKAQAKTAEQALMRDEGWSATALAHWVSFRPKIGCTALDCGLIMARRTDVNQTAPGLPGTFNLTKDEARS